jgi:hypothetical protein
MGGLYGLIPPVGPYITLETEMYLNRLSIALIQCASAPRGAMPQTELIVGQRAKIALKLIQAVDETLEMFGRKAKSQVYDYLEKNFGLRRDDILDKPETFSKGLRSLFGSASRHIELNIVERVHSKLGISFQRSEKFNFVDYVASLEA